MWFACFFETRKVVMMIHLCVTERCLLYSMQLWGSTVGSLRVAAGTIFNKVLIIVVTLAFLHFFSVQWLVTCLIVGQGKLGKYFSSVTRQQRLFKFGIPEHPNYGFRR